MQKTDEHALAPTESPGQNAKSAEGSVRVAASGKRPELAALRAVGVKKSDVRRSPNSSSQTS